MSHSWNVTSSVHPTNLHEVECPHRQVYHRKREITGICNKDGQTPNVNPSLLCGVKTCGVNSP